MPSVVIPGKTSRAQVALTAQGILAENISPHLLTGALAPATQSVYGYLFGLSAGDVVTGVVLRNATAAGGTLPTLARFGLADSTGKMLALSGDESALASWPAGAVGHAFAAAYTVPSDGGYYGCFVVNGVWGTPPTIARNGAPAGATGKVFGSNAAPGFIWLAQTDLPALGASLTITANGNTQSFYMALY